MNSAQWYQYSLTEKEAKELIGHVRGAVRYGLVLTYNQLPSEAKQIVDEAYEKKDEAVSKPGEMGLKAWKRGSLL